MFTEDEYISEGEYQEMYNKMLVAETIYNFWNDDESVNGLLSTLYDIVTWPDSKDLKGDDALKQFKEDIQEEREYLKQFEEALEKLQKIANERADYWRKLWYKYNEILESPEYLKAIGEYDDDGYPESKSWEDYTRSEILGMK